MSFYKMIRFLVLSTLLHLIALAAPSRSSTSTPVVVESLKANPDGWTQVRTQDLDNLRRH
jgi:hypothetical protein